MTIEEKSNKIIEAVRCEEGTNPIRMFKKIAKKDYISIHGPEHHILDGACLLMAFYNAGGKIDIDEGLKKLLYEGLKMPGAMCGLWGICGAITSIGAALSIIDGTGPLSEDGTWGNHMAFTSSAIGELGRINGPRCCKRDAMIAFKHGILYVNQHYGVHLEYEEQTCEFSAQNQQCIKDRCPFYEGGQMRIETERLILRPFQERDAEDVFEYLNEPAVNCFADMKLNSIEEARQEVIKRSSETEYYFAIVLKESGKVIGEIDAYPEPADEHGADSEMDTFSPCWMLNKAYHGKGYAYEASCAFFDYLFKDKGARRIYAYTEDYNKASQHLCEKLGMRQEGLFKEFISFVKNPDGTPHYENTYQYAILKKEWGEG